MVFGGQTSEVASSNVVFAFHLEFKQWFKLFQMSPPPQRMNFAMAQVTPTTVLVLGGTQKTKSGHKTLSDLWQLSTDLVQGDLTAQNLAKKKDLTGSVWTMVEFRIHSRAGVLDFQSSKAKFASLNCFQFSKISDKQAILMSLEACFVYEIGQQVFTEIDLKVSIQNERDFFLPNLPLHIIDLSNYNLGIFQFLVVQPNHQLALLDIQNQSLGFLGAVSQVGDLKEILGREQLYLEQEYQDQNIFIVDPENLCMLTQLQLEIDFQSPRETEEDAELIQPEDQMI
jgi:hypothetical protein